MSSNRLKFSCPVKDLKKTLDRLASIPGAKAVVPMVRITSAMDGLTLTRITPEAMMRATTEDSDIEGEGEVEVGFTIFSQLVGRCGAQLIKVEDAGDKLTLQSGAAKMILLKAPPGNMPAPMVPDAKCEIINLPIKDLMNYMGVVAGAASVDATETALLGVCARTMLGGKLHFFATNRKAMHCVATPFDIKVDTLIPNEVVGALKTAFADMDAVASIGFHANGLRVLTERVELFASVSEGRPPNIEGLLQSVYAEPVIRRITADRGALIEALETVTPVTAVDLKAVDLHLEKGQLVVEAKNNRDAEITMRIDAKTEGEGSVRIGAGHLAGVLRCATGEDVTVTNVANAIYVRQEDRCFTVGIMRAESPVS